MTLPWTSEPERRWWQVPVFWTLALSLVLHVLGLLLWTALPAFLAHPPSWMPQWLVAAARTVPPLVPVMQPVRPSPPQPPEPEFEIPLSFIEVDPSLAVTEAPKSAQFQSTANTVAQNLAAPKPELKQPFIGGTQEKYPKTFDTEKVQPKAEPKPKEAPDVELAEAERVRQEPKILKEKQEPVPAQPPVTQPKGEIEVALVKAAPGPVAPPRPQAPPPKEAQAAQAPQEEQRPARRKSLKNLAQARQTKGIIVGEQMKQDGGVEKRGSGAFNVQRGPMGDYGERMWHAVQERWYATLEAQKFAGEFRGKVVIDFKLHPDGNVSQVEIKNEGADDGIYSMYCIASIQLSASFGNWSNEMRATYGLKPIDCQCVFWY